MPETSSWSGYLRTLLLGLLLLVAVVAGFNAAIDPFDMFGGGAELGKWNRYKTGVTANNRLALTHRLRQQQPELLVMGSSRVQIGIDPGDIEGKALRAYNAALRGTTLEELQAYVTHALAVAPVKEVVIGLDFMFANAARSEKPHFDPSRLRGGEGWLPSEVFPYSLRDLAIGLLSMTAIKESMRSLQRHTGFRPEDNAVLASGMMDSSGWPELIRGYGGGQREFFQNKERTHLVKAWFIPPYNNFCSTHPVTGEDIWPQLTGLLQALLEKQVKVTLFLQPSHIRNHLYIRATGLQPRYEAWLRELTVLTHVLNRTAPAGTPAITLWDFGFPTALTMEAVPEWGDRQTVMQGYLEFSHYTPWMGQKLLTRLYGGDTEQQKLPEMFGVRLQPEMLSGYIDRQTEAVTAYIDAQPEEWQEVQQIVAEELGEVRAAPCVQEAVTPPGTS